LNEFVETREVVERIKDIVSKEQEGFVYDYQIADILKMGYSTLRFAIAKNKLPLKEIARFCYQRDLIINELILKEKR